MFINVITARLDALFLLCFLLPKGAPFAVSLVFLQQKAMS